MTEVSRRFALKVLATGSVATAARAEAGERPKVAPKGVENPTPMPEAVGLLYDATKCIGCKACVSKCAEVNGLPPDTGDSGGKWQMPEDLNCQTRNIIKLFQGDGGEQSFVKQQCMHCLDPACVTACPFNALSKDGTNGIVGWDGSKCLGCRYCEVACPYEVPKFEWQTVNPRIVKCELCAHRLAVGQEPGCTEVCPTKAVVFGKREKLLADAHARIEEAPKGTYFEDRVYGEKEGGGTQMLYLSAVDFTKLGLPALPQSSISHWGTKVHGTVYKYMTGPLVVFAGMFAFIKKNWSQHVEHLKKDEENSGDRPQF